MNISKNYRTFIIIGTVFGLIGLLVNFVFAAQKYLWLDEIYTLLNINFISVIDLIISFWNGADTHPPGYFIIAYLIQAVFHTVYALKILSLCFGLLGLYFIKQTYRNISNYIFAIVLVAVTTIPFFSTYLICEIRPYGYYFFSTSLLVWSTQKIVREKSGFPTFVFSAIIFLTSHYFAFFYFLTLIIYLFWKNNWKFIDRPIIVSLTILLCVGLPMVFMAYRQFVAVQFTTWQKTPHLVDLILLVKLFGTYSIMFIMGLIIIYGKLINKKYGAIIKQSNGFEWKLQILFFCIPFLMYVLCHIGMGIFLPRYFIPTFYSLIVLFIFIINILRNNQLLKLIVLTCLILLLG